MFKNVLKELRISHQMTQDQLAQKAGLAKSTISMYENGNREPDLEQLEIFADIFNVDMNRLTGKLNERQLAANVGNELWEKLSKDETKLALAEWIVTLNPEQLERVEKLLDAALLSPRE